MQPSGNLSGERVLAFRLDPLDVLFFRDGRPFGVTARGQSGLPMPQTLSGAIRTHLLRAAGCDLDAFARLAQQLRSGRSREEAMRIACGAGWIARVAVRGPWLCRQIGPQLEVLLPVPANLQQVEDAARHELLGVNAARANVAQAHGNGDQVHPRWVRLDPLHAEKELPGWQPPIDGMRPLWFRQRVRGKRKMGYLRPAGLKAYLAGQTPEADSLVAPDELFGFDHRTGIVLRPDELTAEEGLLYSVSLLALRPGVGFYAEVLLPLDAPQEVLRQPTVLDFGGEGRKVRVQPVDRFAWPETASLPHGRRLILLTTPGIFAQRWRPPLPDGTKLVAAAVPGYEAFSGWDLARGGPRPTRFAAPAGSVYFLESSCEPFPDGSLAESDDDRRLGFGCFLQGVWNDV